MPVPIDRALVGMVDAPVAPSDDPARLPNGHAHAARPLTVGEHVTLRLVHTVGHHGMDDRGSLEIAMRFPADGGRGRRRIRPHRIEASRPYRFRAKFEAFGNARPPGRLRIRVVDPEGRVIATSNPIVSRGAAALPFVGQSLGQ